MPKTPHLALKQEYHNLPLRLTTEASLFYPPPNSERRKLRVTALWDTGAMRSAITHEAARLLNLVPFDKVKVNGVNSIGLAEVVNVSICLPNYIIVENVNVTVCSLVKDVDFLIGMDIIQLGDFSISNGGGNTLFSFVIPPFENRTDHYEKAEAVNKRNKFQL